MCKIGDDSCRGLILDYSDGSRSRSTTPHVGRGLGRRNSSGKPPLVKNHIIDKNLTAALG